MRRKEKERIVEKSALGHGMPLFSELSGREAMGKSLALALAQ